MTTMIANHSFRYDGKRLSKGSEFTVMGKINVHLLSKLNHAKVKTPIVESVVKPLPLQITAEPPDEIDASLIEKPKRRYRRRDMEAEE